MEDRTILISLRQLFQRILPSEDRRTTLAPLAFVTGLSFCFLGDTKSFSLESLRRSLMSRFEVKISKGAFWDRLAGARLRGHLEEILSELLRLSPRLGTSAKTLAKRLGVEGIYLIDSSSVTLTDKAESAYPGSRTGSSIKWHACVDLLSGQMPWFELSPGRRHDRRCFPDLSSLHRRLVMMDLGYWDYSLLNAIEAAGGFFLSRIKANACIHIGTVCRGLSEVNLGESISHLTLPKKRYRILEAIGEVRSPEATELYRMVGFWNPSQQVYHWYITNLTVEARLLYPLYRLRWQLELWFKMSKRSFNLDRRLRSANPGIIEALVLSSLVAVVSAQLVRHIAATGLDREQQLAVSIQRLGHLVVQVAEQIVALITHNGPRVVDRLLSKIRLFAPEIVEKNYRKRRTSLAHVNDLLAA